MRKVSSFSDTIHFRVEVHHEDGSYWAQVVEMPGCFASGDTFDELREALAEAIGLYLSSANVTIDIRELEMIEIGRDDDVSCFDARVPAGV